MKVLASAVFVALVLVAGDQARVSTAVNCNPNELSACSGALFLGTPPTRDCCNKLNQQVGCFCQYIKNPALRPYINSANAKKMTATCHTPTPKC